MKSNTLSQLGISDTLVFEFRSGTIAILLLAHSQDGAGGDPRAVCSASDDEVAMAILLRFSAQRDEEMFALQEHSCPVCMMDVPGHHCIRLRCRHSACDECLRHHCAAKIAGGDFAISCVLCEEPIAIDALRSLLGGVSHAKLQSAFPGLLSH